FFQAEDGIRDRTVTGVQTCALPILRQELAGCCATDAHTYLGQWPADFPVILGHENVGIVEAIGSGGAVDFLGRALRVGDRIIAQIGRASCRERGWSWVGCLCEYGVM